MAPRFPRSSASDRHRGRLRVEPPLRRAVVEALLPELEREQAPKVAAELAFAFDQRVDVEARVEGGALAGRLARERLAEELAELAPHPRTERHGPHHLVLPVADARRQ